MKDHFNPYADVCRHYEGHGEDRRREDEFALEILGALLSFSERAAYPTHDCFAQWNNDLYRAALETAMLRITEDMALCDSETGGNAGIPQNP